MLLYYPYAKIDLLPTLQILVEHCTGIAEVKKIFFRLLFRNCLNCVSTAKIFHNVITHNRGTNPVTITLYIVVLAVPLVFTT